MKTPKTDKVLKEFDRVITKKSKDNLNKKGSSGKLKNSIDVSSKIVGTSIQIDISMEDYGVYVDQGRKPGKGIPVNTLQSWIREKKMTVKDVNGNSLTMNQTRINGLSYIINRKIKQEGIKPTYFFTKPLDDMINKFADDIANAMADDIIDDMLANFIE